MLEARSPVETLFTTELEVNPEFDVEVIKFSFLEEDETEA